MIDQKKLLSIFIALTLFVNYQNYFEVNIDKKQINIKRLKTRITQEIQLNKTKKEVKNILLQNHKKSYMFSSDTYSYSKAMGEFQNQITQSAKGICTIKQIKWSSSVFTKSWYDKLRMSVMLECKADDFFTFTNRMKSIGKLYNLDNLRIIKLNKKNRLFINMSILAYRDNTDAK